MYNQRAVPSLAGGLELDCDSLTLEMLAPCTTLTVGTASIGTLILPACAY